MMRRTEAKLQTPYRDLLPPLASEEQEALAADIKIHGVQVPVLVDEAGNVLDGHNRLDIDPAAPRRVVRGIPDAEKPAFVWRQNWQRRNLSPAQKAAVLEAMKADAARLRELDAKRYTQKRLAALYGVAQQTIADWFPPKGSGTNTGAGNASATAGGRPDARVKVPPKEKPRLAERIEQGEAAAQVAADYGITERHARSIHQKETTRAKQRAQDRLAMRNADHRPEIYSDDALAWIAKQESCDLLLTDPPYSTDVEDLEAFAAAWLPKSLEKIKPTGRAYVFIGAYPPELRVYLNIDPPDHLQLAQILVWTYRNTIGPKPALDYVLNWQAVLYYRGTEAPALRCDQISEQFAVLDFSAPDGRHATRSHRWEKPQSLAERLIEQSTEPEALVLDCFAGTGTFLLAAAKLGRQARGCERDLEMLRIAETKGCRWVARGKKTNASP